MDLFEQIKKPIESQLQECRSMFCDSLTHTTPLLDQALTQVKARSGKMMRPILVLLSAKLFGSIKENALQVAVAYETFHTASLIHDDVVDESEERRGQKSVNTSFDNKVAVLVGDFILAKTLQHLAATDIPQLIDILASAAQRLSNGELLQLYNISNEVISEDTYYEIIRNKTAALFTACATSGAIVAGASEEDAELLRQYGENLGICFQIKDDIFDYEDANVGKPTGNDMKEGKLTLPAIYAVTHSNGEMDEIVGKVKQSKATEEEIATLVAFTKKNGGIEYALAAMNEYAKKAKHMLDKFPESDTKTALLAYVDLVVERKY
ncbi:MAG: polyprenyl synthetase family protein [Bacteroidaceae bacterium]|nr:polyprenyl synthetase family protein [Bacteroidaceae bacterium]